MLADGFIYCTHPSVEDAVPVDMLVDPLKKSGLVKRNRDVLVSDDQLLCTRNL